MRGQSFPQFASDKNLGPNWFSGNKTSSFTISFAINGKAYHYSFSYDFEKSVYSMESLSIIDSDKKIFSFDSTKNEYEGECKDLSSQVSHISPLLYTIDVEKDAEMKNARDDFKAFAKSLSFFSGPQYNIAKTISIMRKGGKSADRIKDFVKQADVNLNDFYFACPPEGSKPKADEDFNYFDMERLHTKYKDHDVESMAFDSNGTQKIESLAGFVVDALENRKTLIVDELDSSLFFKITRSIVAAFNNSGNSSSQLIFTTHDVSIMDVKYLMRKDQIVFLNRDEKGETYSKSLADFSAKKDGVRGDEANLADKYRKDLIQNLPDPDFIDVLFDISEETNCDASKKD
jgi:hypothetical protein